MDLSAAAPVAPRLALDTAAGSLPAGVYYYQITAIDSAGNESLPSAETSLTVPPHGGAAEVDLNWAGVPGAVAYHVYRGTASREEDTVQTASGTSFADGVFSGGSEGSPPEVVDLLGAGPDQCGGGRYTTICFVAAQSHVGVIHLFSATDGVQEAMNLAEGSSIGWSGSEVYVPSGNHSIYARVLLSHSGITLAGGGDAATQLNLIGASAGVLVLNSSHVTVRGLYIHGDNASSGFDLAFEVTTGHGGPGDDAATNLLLDGAVSPAADIWGRVVPSAGLYVAAVDSMSVDQVRSVYNDYGVIVDADGGGGGSGFYDSSEDTSFNLKGGVLMRGAVTGVCFSGGRVFSNNGPGIVVNALGGQISGLHMEGNVSDIVLEAGTDGVAINGNLLSMDTAAAKCIVCGNGTVRGLVMQANVFDVLDGVTVTLDSLVDVLAVNSSVGPNVLTAFLSMPATVAYALTLQPGSSNNTFIPFSLDPNAQIAGGALTVVEQYHASVLGAGFEVTAGSWKWAGPATLLLPGGAPLGGAMAALALAPEGGVYAGGLGGVWSFDGSRWRNLTPAAGWPISAIAASSDDSTVFAGGGYWGGISFKDSRAGLGVMVSRDGGQTWSAVGAGPLAGLLVSRIVVAPGSSSHLIASAVSAADSPPSAQPGLYSSEDGGQSWTLLLPGSVWDCAWIGNSVLVAVGGSLAISQGGGPFTKLNGIAPFVRASLGAHEGVFLALLAGGSQPEVVEIGVSGSLSGSFALPLGDGGLASGEGGVALTADGIGRIFVSGSRLWVASWGGPWSELGGNVQFGESRSLLADGDNNLWLATDSGAWLSPNGGPLSDCNFGLDNFGVAAVRAGSGVEPLVVLAGSAITAQEDALGHWAASDGGDLVATNSMVAVDGIHPQIEATVLDNVVQLSVDSGVSWQPLGGLPMVPITAVEFDDHQNLWAATLGAGLWEMSLGGVALHLTVAAPEEADVGGVVAVAATAEELGRPMAGAVVVFQSGSWSVALATDGAGVATADVPVPTFAGRFSVGATMGSVSVSTEVLATPGPPAALDAFGGQGQHGDAGQVLPEPLSVRVTDRLGNPISDVAVAFSSTGGVLSSASVETDQSGVAAVTLRLPPSSMAVTVTASLKGISAAEFSERADAYFHISLSPVSLAVLQGHTADFVLNSTVGGGFAAPLTLLCQQPAGGCSVTPEVVRPGESAIVSVAAPDVHSGLDGVVEVDVLAVASGLAAQSVTGTVKVEGLTLESDLSAVQLMPGIESYLVIRVGALNGLSCLAGLQMTSGGKAQLPGGLHVAFLPSPVVWVSSVSPATVRAKIWLGSRQGAGESAFALMFAVLALFAFLLFRCHRPGRSRIRRSVIIGLLSLSASYCGSGAVSPESAPRNLGSVTYPLILATKCSGVSASVPVEVKVEVVPSSSGSKPLSSGGVD